MRGILSQWVGGSKTEKRQIHMGEATQIDLKSAKKTKGKASFLGMMIKLLGMNPRKPVPEKNISNGQPHDALENDENSASAEQQAESVRMLQIPLAAQIKLKDQSTSVKTNRQSPSGSELKDSSVIAKIALKNESETEDLPKTDRGLEPIAGQEIQSLKPQNEAISDTSPEQDNNQQGKYSISGEKALIDVNRETQNNAESGKEITSKMAVRRVPGNSEKNEMLKIGKKNFNAIEVDKVGTNHHNIKNLAADPLGENPDAESRNKINSIGRSGMNGVEGITEPAGKIKLDKKNQSDLANGQINVAGKQKKSEWLATKSIKNELTQDRRAFTKSDPGDKSHRQVANSPKGIINKANNNHTKTTVRKTTSRSNHAGSTGRMANMMSVSSGDGHSKAAANNHSVLKQDTALFKTVTVPSEGLGEPTAQMDMDSDNSEEFSKQPKKQFEGVQSKNLKTPQFTEGTDHKSFSQKLTQVGARHTSAGQRNSPQVKQWKHHRFMLQNGKAIHIAARSSDGALQLQLNTGSGELGRMLHQHLHEIQQHVQQQLNIEIDLQLQDFGGQQPDRESEASTKNKATTGSSSDEGSPVLGSNKLSDPRRVRYLGFNNNEWTA